MPVRLTILVRKQDHLSNEEFHKYWSESHPPIFLGVPIVRRNVTKYSQFHVDQSVSQSLAKDHHLPMAPYDGGVNIWAEDMDKLMAIFQDEDYIRVVIPDESSFLKRDEVSMMIGWDEDKKVS